MLWDKLGKWVEWVLASSKAAPDFRNRFVRRHNWSVKPSNRCVGRQRQLCEKAVLKFGGWSEIRMWAACEAVQCSVGLGGQWGGVMGL